MNTNPNEANTKVTKATQEVTMRRDIDLRDLFCCPRDLRIRLFAVDVARLSRY